MTAADILPHLQRWADVITGIELALDPLREIMGIDPESPLHEAIYAAIGLANEWAADKVGTSVDWLEWYWLENRMGKRTHEAGLTGNLRTIRNLEDFAKLLAEDLAAS